MDAGRCLFLDETVTATHMTRRDGRCPAAPAARRSRPAFMPPCGLSLRGIGLKPDGHWKTTTFIAGRRRTGIVAPLVLDGPVTGRAFCAQVEQVLLSTLDPGDVVAPGHLAAHRVKGVQAAIAAAGAHLLYLPPCSPDLTRSRWCSPRVKAMPRKTAARTRHQLWAAIGALVPAVSAAEGASYLHHRGDDATEDETARDAC